jgi:hypothetical protein
MTRDKPEEARSLRCQARVLDQKAEATSNRRLRDQLRRIAEDRRELADEAELQSAEFRPWRPRP